MSWNSKLPAALKKAGVDLILTSNSTYNTSYSEDGQALTGQPGLDASVTGQREARSKLSDIAPLVEILDTPTPGDQIKCLTDKAADDCTVDESEATTGKNEVQKAALSELPTVKSMDFTKYFCQNGTCPAVVNNVVVFRDSNHMTSEYSRTLAKPLADALRRNTSDSLWTS